MKEIKTKNLQMKKIILGVAVYMLVVNVSAQKGKSEETKPFRFSAGLESALPLGNFGKNATFGIGGSAQADYKVANNVDISLNAGYISFGGKSRIISGLGTFKFSTQNYIPVLAGAKFHFSEKIFGSTQLGVTFIPFESVSGSESTFTFSPGVGYKFSKYFDAVLKYTAYSATSLGTASTIGLRVGYTF